MKEPTAPVYTKEELAVLGCYARYPKQYADHPAVLKQEEFRREWDRWFLHQRAEQKKQAEERDEAKLNTVRALLSDFRARTIDSRQLDALIKATIAA